MVKKYLRLERDRVQTAKELYIHKNTLVYRLRKAKELFAIDFTSPYEREYLLLSYRCGEKHENSHTSE
jgi:DNA-binding PucR family transcriptional regulator